MSKKVAKMVSIVASLIVSATAQEITLKGVVWSSSKKDNLEVTLQHRPKIQNQKKKQFFSGLTIGKADVPYRVLDEMPNLYASAVASSYGAMVKVLGSSDPKLGVSNSWGVGEIEHKLETWTFVVFDEKGGNILKVEAQFKRKIDSKEDWEKVTSDYLIGRFIES